MNNTIMIGYFIFGIISFIIMMRISYIEVFKIENCYILFGLLCFMFGYFGFVASLIIYLIISAQEDEDWLITKLLNKIINKK